METLDTNFSKITTLKKQDGTVLYPRTVTEAIVDGEGKSLTEIISNLTVAKNDQITLIGAVKDKVINLEAAMQSKVDKEEGKVLSTNDFTDELKAKLESLEPTNDIISLLDYKVDKVDGKDLSTNDFTNDLKAKLDALPTRSELDAIIASLGGSTGGGDVIVGDCKFSDELKAKLEALPTREELDAMLLMEIEGEGEEPQTVTTVVTNNVERIKELDETVIQNVTVEESKIVFTNKNNTIVNELEIVNEDDSNDILNSIFE